MSAHSLKLNITILSIRSMAIAILLCVLFIYYNFAISNSYQKKRQNNACGVILFVHINKCGGGSVDRWFKTHAPLLFLTPPGYHKDEQSIKDTNTLWQKMVPKATRFISGVSNESGWKVLHHHVYFPGIFYSQKIIRQWKKTVEDKGCIFHKTTILRDPLDRFISSVNWYKPPMKDINTFMYSRRNWLIRYILFGICGYYDKELRCGFNRKGNFTMTPSLNKTHVKEAKRIMNTFDSIGFLDKLGEYLENIRNVTGWKDNRMNHKRSVNIHKSKDSFNLSKKLFTEFVKLNQEDYMFYYTIRNQMFLDS